VFAARAGVLRARAASAPAEIRSFFIAKFPTGSKIRLPRLWVRSPVALQLTLPAYGFPQGIG
jgi:hypothetical protein